MILHTKTVSAQFDKNSRCWCGLQYKRWGPSCWARCSSKMRAIKEMPLWTSFTWGNCSLLKMTIPDITPSSQILSQQMSSHYFLRWSIRIKFQPVIFKGRFWRRSLCALEFRRPWTCCRRCQILCPPGMDMFLWLCSRLDTNFSWQSPPSSTCGNATPPSEDK